MMELEPNCFCKIHPHGHPSLFSCPTKKVLWDVEDHRAVQVDRYGDNADLKDGTGPGVRWLEPLTKASASGIEARLRAEYESHGAVAPDWMRLVREEVAEAFQENDPVRLREELIQVAALAVSWIEKLDGRRDVNTSPNP